VVELGPLVNNVRQDEPIDLSRISLDLIASPTPAPGRPDASVPPPPPPTIERAGGIRTVVIDPGHGGSDIGTRNPAGLEERHITLAAAQRLRALLEAQLGVRAILTREGDTDVAIDSRAAIANNNKADLFISLHVNASHASTMRGWQVQSLDPADYAAPEADDTTAPQSVPLAGGGTRVIHIVPWQLAQIPHARQSATLAELLAARLADSGIPGQAVPVLQTPARVLVGANMPAVLIEMGFVTNGEDAVQLESSAFHSKLADVIASVINGLRAGWPPASGGGRP
jgi:N-acetylmuramoyl-L-alanine amidase